MTKSLPANKRLLDVLIEIGATAQLGELTWQHRQVHRPNALREAVGAVEVVWRRDEAATRDLGAVSRYAPTAEQQEVRNA